jgi:hypothetical protein
MATVCFIEIIVPADRTVRERINFALFTLAQIKMLVKGTALRHRWIKPLRIHHCGTLAQAQTIANHESPRTTKSNDGTREGFSFEEVERLTIYANKDYLSKLINEVDVDPQFVDQALPAKALDWLDVLRR